jgi:DNA-directed RNA polymerase specialized sigma24 family protein
MDDPPLDQGASFDAAAVARVASGDAVALRELYDRYGKIVYSFAYRLTGDATLSEECVQDVFVALWRRAADFDPPSTWDGRRPADRSCETISSRPARHPTRPISLRTQTRHSESAKRWPSFPKSSLPFSASLTSTAFPTPRSRN